MTRVPVRARMPAEKKFAMKGKKLLKRRGVVHPDPVPRGANYPLNGIDIPARGNVFALGRAVAEQQKLLKQADAEASRNLLPVPPKTPRELAAQHRSRKKGTGRPLAPLSRPRAIGR